MCRPSSATPSTPPALLPNPMQPGMHSSPKAAASSTYPSQRNTLFLLAKKSFTARSILFPCSTNCTAWVSYENTTGC